MPLSTDDSPLFTIVSVFNRRAVLDEWLIPSLQNQSASYELRLVDNAGGAFASAASALNHGAQDARGEYLMFVHQDVQLPLDDSHWLDKAATLMRQQPTLGVAGIIGTTGDGRSAKPSSFNSITQGVPPNIWTVKNPEITQPMPVQTLDEMLLFVPRAVFQRLPFDDAACPNWHLYGVDYALSVGKLGLQAYVLPLSLHHVSPGTVDPSYYQTLRQLLPKHRASHEWLYTGCGVWNTRSAVSVQRVRHKLRSAFRLAQMKLGALFERKHHRSLSS